MKKNNYVRDHEILDAAIFSIFPKDHPIHKIICPSARVNTNSAVCSFCSREYNIALRIWNKKNKSGDKCDS